MVPMRFTFFAAATATLLVLVLASLRAPSMARACALVSGPEATVYVDGEEVLLLWDADNEKEHLIRHIAFRGDAEDFGFLVPTPGEPEIAEVHGHPFDTLFDLYYRRPRPRPRRSRTRVSATGTLLGAFGVGVAVIAEHRVAGQTATVLQASDAGALDRWLAQNGYPSGPALEAYVRPYVARGWMITAFKYDKSAPQVQSRTLRISFDTPQPFFPYAEPRGRRPARPFRLSVVAPTPMRAHLSVNAARGQRWGARVGYRAALGAGARGRILSEAGVPLDAEALHLTTWDEPRSRRGHLDLFFAAAPRARPVDPGIRTRIVPPRQGTPVSHQAPLRARADLLAVERRGGVGEFEDRSVQHFARRRLNAMRRCAERALRTNPTAAGELDVVFTIHERGTVSGVSVERNTTGEVAIGQCVAAIIQRFRFRPGPSEGEASYVIKLRVAPAPRPRSAPTQVLDRWEG